MSLRELFLLDPDVVFLNHGSFGACPRPVFERHQEWQRELERAPVKFLLRRLDGLLAEVRGRLGEEVGARADDLLFVPNASTGLNMVARSPRFEAGDEVLTTTHEYGALDLTWEFLCGRSRARYVRRPLPLPAGSPEEAVEAIWSGVGERTRVLFISHITSPTALVLPVAEVCRRAREAGILTLVDGAHAPGQIPLDVEAVGADVYAGNCHKWLCGPKACGFLWVRPEHQAWIEPLIVSWGFAPEQSFRARRHWPGTHDPAAILSVPAAIDFQREHDWPTVRARCHELAAEARSALLEWWGLEPLSREDDQWYAQMVALPLPACDPADVQRRLMDEHGIEVPVWEWEGRPLIRISLQGYNTSEDVERLVEALPRVVGRGKSAEPGRRSP